MVETSTRMKKKWDERLLIVIGIVVVGLINSISSRLFTPLDNTPGVQSQMVKEMRSLLDQKSEGATTRQSKRKFGLNNNNNDTSSTIISQEEKPMEHTASETENDMKGRLSHTCQVKGKNITILQTPSFIIVGAQKGKDLLRRRSCAFF